MATQRWPAAWLLTDERLGDRLDAAMVRAAASGAGIIVRHHNSDLAIRRDLAERVRRLGATLGVARDVGLAREVGADLVHNPEGECGSLPFSLAIHDEAEAMAAAGRAAALVFVSPVFATRSHPGAAPLGVERAVALAGLAGCPAYALGGVDEESAGPLIARGFAGWAGIDAWIRT